MAKLVKNNSQKQESQEKKSEKKSLKEYFVEAFKKNYTTSFFLLFMFIGWVLDLSMGTMPRYTLTGMVLGAVIGSCASVKKRNNEKEREERLNGKKYM